MSEIFTMIPLSKVVLSVERPEVPDVEKMYRQIGVKLWGEGAYERETISGSQTSYSTLSQVKTDDIIVNKIWARNGSVAVVPRGLDGCYRSSEFPTFVPIQNKLYPRWFHWLTKTSSFWEQCDDKSRGTSGKNRIRPEKFLEIVIPLPTYKEQQRIVVRIEEFAAKIEEAQGLFKATGSDMYNTLLSKYYSMVKDTKRLPMKEVAPLERRPIQLDLGKEYHELGIRSFGKGTFHKAPLTGASLGTKHIFQIEANDLLFNIVFAWEGAVAVAKVEDYGRVGSHRFLTCVPKKGLATSSFLCFHFLTEHGLQQLRDASPGSAGRNRTLGIKALEEILVPVPDFEKQLEFDALQEKFNEVKLLNTKTKAELDALLPSILDKAFKGEL